MPTAQDMVEEARKWVGTPWRHQGRTRVGVDCVGLLVVCARAIGLEVEDRTDYGQSPTNDSLLRHLSSYLTKAHNNQILPGRIGLFTENRFPCHVGIFSDVDGAPHLIHAFARRRMVVEEPFGERSNGFRLIGVFDVSALKE